MTIAAPTIISAEGIQQRQLFLEEESLALKRAVNREGIFLLGPRVQNLEGFLQARYQVAQALGTNAGTSALELACEGLKEHSSETGSPTGSDQTTGTSCCPGKTGNGPSALP